MDIKKIRIGVLMGGLSIEREVSFNSGRTVCDHIDSERYDIVPLFQTLGNKLYILPWPFLHRGKITDFEHRLENEAQCITWDSLKNLIDLAFIAMHGRFAEDGTMQGFLEVLGIPYVGTKVLGSALGMNKIQQKIFLRNAGIDVPHDMCIPGHSVNKLTLADLLTKNIPLPCIVKPAQEGSSLGISVVHSTNDLLAAITKASTAHPNKYQDVVIEEYLEGMEFCCTILTDYTTGELIPLQPTEVVRESTSTFLDYDQKYMPGRALKFTPARCTAEHISLIQQTCVKVMHALDFKNIGRIDGFLTPDNRVVIIDPNSFSGAAPSSFLFKQAAEHNMNHTQLINHLIETEIAASTLALHNPTSKEKTMLADKKIRVAVLFGGASHEKEISLESGRNVLYKLSPQKYDATPVFVSSALELFAINNRLLVCNRTNEIEKQLEPAMNIPWNDLPARFDFVFIALHGGAGENGAVQGTLEMLGMPYNGSSVLTSALCMDKYKTCTFLKSQGFSVPQAQLVTAESWHGNEAAVAAQTVATLGLPCIVKPHDDGCSVMVFKVASEQEFIKAITTILNDGKATALAEEFVVGTELTGGVVGNTKARALPPSEAIANKGILSIEEKFLPGAGENQTPARIGAHALALVQQTLEDAYTALGCKGYARIDCFYQAAHVSPTGTERVVILEVNNLPGLTPATCIFHQAAEVGMKPMEFIDLIVQYGFEEHGNSAQNTMRSTQEVVL